MILNYGGRRKWPASLKTSVFMLVVLVPAVTICWFSINSMLGNYFRLLRDDNDPLRSPVYLACRVLDTLPEVVLMTIASVGATLAAVNWREGFAAKAFLGSHAAVFGVSAYAMFVLNPVVV